MTSSTAAPPTSDRTRRRRVLVVVAAVLAVAGTGAMWSSGRWSSLPDGGAGDLVRSITTERRASDDGPAITDDDGALPDGASPFDRDQPGVTELDPALLDAVREAAADAEADGVDVRVTSGWRSPEYQAQLLRDAVSTYGSLAEAERWVATPETSSHVSGDAVDLGPAAARTWLSRHGASYGLCQIYGNEPWHFELRPDAVRSGCPRPFPDPTHDPRMVHG